MDQDRIRQGVLAPSPRARRQSPFLTVGAAVLIAAIGLHCLRPVFDARVRGDDAYAWLLRFPGTPPGATFKTMPGDDLTVILDTVLPEDRSPWKALLAHGGNVDIHLFGRVTRRVSLAKRIAWWWGDRRWRSGITDVQFALPVVRIRQLPSSAYEVVRVRKGDVEPLAGPIAQFEEARQATIVEVAKLIDSFQKGEKIEGMSGIFPADLFH